MRTIGEFSDEILKAPLPKYVAIRLRGCNFCEEGWKEHGYPAEAGLPAKEPVKCDACDGTATVLDLDEAIPCEVKTVVTVENIVKGERP